MQNLPVITAPPAASTYTSAATDNNSSTQAAEPFGDVLARQYANAVPSQNINNQDRKQSASPSANDAASNVPGNVLTSQDSTNIATNTLTQDTKDKTTLQAPVPNGVSTLPSDMLAMLIPAPVTTINPVAKDTTRQQTSASVEISALPGYMPVTLTPPTASTGKPTTNDKALPQDTAPDSVSTLSSDMSAMVLTATTAAAGNIQSESLTNRNNKALSMTGMPTLISASFQSVEGKAVSGASGISGVASTLLSNLENSKPGTIATEVNSSKENTLSAALATLSKSSAKTAELDANTTKIQTQQVASPPVDVLLQSGIAPIAASQSSAAQTIINTPVTNQAWGNEFNQKITWMATQHQQTAELHLNPPNLGPLDVVLKVSGDQATALFTSPHAAVRDAVEQALPQLRNMLADSGITLGNAMVSDQSPKDQQAWQASQQQKGNAGLPEIIHSTIVTGGAESVATPSLGPRHLGMVDTFA